MGNLKIAAVLLLSTLIGSTKCDNVPPEELDLRSRGLVTSVKDQGE